MILTKFNKKDFENILSNYNLGSYKSNKYIFTGSNTIYEIKTLKGKFILKVHDKMNLNFIRDEFKIVEFLNKKNFPTSRIILTNDGKNLFFYKNKKISIQKFSEGIHPKKFDESMIKEVAMVLGNLGKNLQNYKGKCRDDWGFSHAFRRIKFKEDSLFNFNLNNESKKVFYEMKKLNKLKLKKSLVHGDLTPLNIFIENNKVISVIDWDDLHLDYRVYEISTFLSLVIFDKRGVNRRLIKTFFRYYEKSIPLNSEEKRAIYYFLKQRFLSATKYYLDKSKIHKDRKKEMLFFAKDRIEKYKILDKISEEDFLKLIK